MAQDIADRIGVFLVRIMDNSSTSPSIPFMLFDIIGAKHEMLVYTTPKKLESDETYTGYSMQMISEMKKLFPHVRLFLFYYLYLPPQNEVPQAKAKFCFQSMITEEGLRCEDMAHVVDHHESYCESADLVNNLLRDTTMKTPCVGFVTKKGDKIEYSKEKPSTMKQGQYGF